MDLTERIQKAIYSAFDDINESLPPEKHLLKAPDTAIYDGTGIIDSLGLTMLVVAIEQKLEQDFGRHIALVSDSFYSKDNVAFRNVQTLTAYISSLLQESHNA